MKIPTSIDEKIKFWQEKLKEHQQKYDQLRQQSPDRWWHDEHFDNQMRILENLIVSAKQRISKLKKETKNK
jgi:hypothetical protein